MRKTLYGTLTYDDELNENEKAMLYIKECAELVGIEVIEGETRFTIQFMAEIMRRLRNIPIKNLGKEIIEQHKQVTKIMKILNKEKK